MILLEGPFESDYSLAIVNRQLASALVALGAPVCLHQRDNTTPYAPAPDFLRAWPQLAGRFVSSPPEVDIHSRYIYPPYTDSMVGNLNVMHCYGWEESVFPDQYIAGINRDIDLITVMSEYVRNVLKHSGVAVPIVVVGLGADHILANPSEPVDIGSGTFDFVHVSSCFPRKAADVLVEAFCQEFRAGEQVRLVIKTFPNPHNTIEEIVQQAQRRNPRHAPIDIWQHPLSTAQMRFVYERAGCLVAPSRGEGFGLPVAEAMTLGCPVIATAHGGHADICTPGGFWPVEFRMEPAKTHVTDANSYWAEPSLDSLRQQMRAVFNSTPEQRSERTTRAKSFVQGRFTWQQTASRHLEACSRLLDGKRAGRKVLGSGLHIGFITTWNTKCGIAEYSRYFISGLESRDRVSVFADATTSTVRPDETNVHRCWVQSLDEEASGARIDEMASRILGAGVDVISFQYNFGFFPPAAFEALIDKLKAAGIAIFVTMHSTQHKNLKKMVTALQNADLCIVHREMDLQRLMQAGVQNCTMLRHGILAPVNRTAHRRPGLHQPFTVACFGFFLPPKGIYDLLQAFELAVRVNPSLRLRLLNALYPVPESSAYAAECLKFIEEKGLADHVEMWTEFLPDEEVLQELSTSDLIVLPYTDSTESCSGAVRLPLAAMAPVLCSDLGLFDEFRHIVHRYPAGDVIALANRILELAENDEELLKFETLQRNEVEELSWPKMAQRFLNLAHAQTTARTTEKLLERPAMHALVD